MNSPTILSSTPMMEAITAFYNQKTESQKHSDIWNEAYVSGFNRCKEIFEKHIEKEKFNQNK